MMNRTAEGKVFFIGSLWTIVISCVTIFGYSSWFHHTGNTEILFERTQVYQNVNILDNLTKFIVLYGLFNLFFGILNLFFSKKINAISGSNKCLIGYFIVWTVIEFISFNLIGVCIYSVGVVIYFSKKKAYKKLKKLEVTNESKI